MNVLVITFFIAAIMAAFASHQYKVATTESHILKNNGKQNMTSYYLFVFLCMATLITVSGLRYYVGSDFSVYYGGYKTYATQFASRWKAWDEPGLATLAKIMHNITKDGASFIFVTAAITVGLFIFTIARNTNTFFFSAVLYMCVCWTGCFNGVRQFLAAAILFAGHRFMLERKFLKFCIVVFIAASFHITALIMLPIYFLVSQVLDLKKIMLIMVSGVAIIYSYDFFFALIGILKDSETGGADTNYAQSEINPLRIVIAFAPIVIYFFLLFQKKGFTGRENFYMGLIFVRAALVFGTANSAYLNRASIYFSPYICIALSLLVQKFPKNQQFILKATIIALYLIVWLYTEVSGLEWYWVFNRGYDYSDLYG